MHQASRDEAARSRAPSEARAHRSAAEMDLSIRFRAASRCEGARGHGRRRKGMPGRSTGHRGPRIGDRGAPLAHRRRAGMTPPQVGSPEGSRPRRSPRCRGACDGTRLRAPALRPVPRRQCCRSASHPRTPGSRGIPRPHRAESGPSAPVESSRSKSSAGSRRTGPSTSARRTKRYAVPSRSCTNASVASRLLSAVLSISESADCPGRVARQNRATGPPRGPASSSATSFTEADELIRTQNLHHAIDLCPGVWKPDGRRQWRFLLEL